MKTDADDLTDTQKHRATPQPVKLHKAVSTSAMRTMLLGIMILLAAIVIVVVIATLALNALLP